MLRSIVPAILAATLLSGSAIAAPPCDAPPYGSDDAGYRSWVMNTARLLDDPDATLSKFCKAKHHQMSRAGLYSLGIKDAEIDSEDTVDLGARALKATKDFVDRP